MTFAVFFPFIAAICLWFLRRNKSSEKEPKMWANVMIAVCAVELVTALFLPVYHLYMDKPLALLFDLEDMSFFHSGLYTHNRVNFWSIGGLSLTFAYGDSRVIFSIITAFAWFAASLFSKEYMKNDINVARFDFFSLFTLGATMGVFLAGDLFTLFIFFEIMSFTSFMWVAHRQTKGALYASGTYLGISVAGGMAILMGLFIVYSKLGTLDLNKVGRLAREFVYYYDGDRSDITLLYVAAGCMFVGFGAKAGAFPVHAWLPKAYVEAPDPATALLSAVLSKTGIWGILIITVSMFSGDVNGGIFVLIIGVITMVYGGLRGVLSDNLKTTLAYSSMSQLGFILVGAGMWGILTRNYDIYTELDFDGLLMAADGTFLHMINHSIVKLVLFFAVGIVFMNVGSYELNRVRGFGHKKPFLLVIFLVAAAGVGGIPLLNGYYSKTLLHESIVKGYEFMARYTIPSLNYTLLMRVVEYLFLFSGGLTVAYMTKLFIVLFVEKNEDDALQTEYESKKEYASILTKLSILLCALPIPIVGISAFFAEENIFSLSSLSGSFISIAVGVIVYFLVVRLIVFNKNENNYKDIFPKWIDIEKYVYRAIFYKAIPFVLGIISRILDSIVDTLVVVLKKTVYSERALPYELPEGNRITHHIGASMENIRHLYYTLSKKDYEPKDYEHKLALKNTDFFESLRIIERSLSFGLFMFCIGLVLTMIYLLVVN